MLEICAIAQQPAHIAELSESEHRRQTLFRGEFGGLLDVKECQGSTKIRSPSGFPAFIAANAVVNSDAFRTSAECTPTSNVFAAAVTSCNSATLAGTPPLKSTAKCDSPGKICCISCSRLSARSDEMQAIPVMFPPGRAMLLTSLSARSQAMMTIGMVAVARLAASMGCGPVVAMTSTLRLTRSAAIAAMSSGFLGTGYAT